MAQAAILDFYVDDIMTGADNPDSALELQRQLIAMLKKGGMNLRKWTSNSRELLQDLPPEQIEAKFLEISESDTIKALGIGWSPINDNFQYSVKMPLTKSCTKRQILSEVASLFDPQGWLAPVIVRAKIIIQKLWKENLDWNTKIPHEVYLEWAEFKQDLHHLEKIRIPRWMKLTQVSTIQLHGFCDASEKAFGAVVYARVKTGEQVHITLLVAKTRVTPLKDKISIPRLELNSSVLLAELLHSVSLAMRMPDIEMFAWSDSQIALAWLSKDASTWETYVANRVAKVHGLINKNIWAHVISEENPADAASRGSSPAGFDQNLLWWTGPNWLKQESSFWPRRCLPDAEGEINSEDDEPVNLMIALSLLTKCSTQDKNLIAREKKCETKHIQDVELLTRFSSFTRLQRVTAYCLRFSENCQTKRTNGSPLSALELRRAEEKLVKLAQSQYFITEVKRLSQGFS